jgi:glyoxylate reductase
VRVPATGAVSENRVVARCFVTRKLPGSALDRLAAAHEVEVWPERMPPPYEALREQAARSEGLLTLLTDRVDAALIESSPLLKAVANYAVGYDNIDLEAATKRGIQVGNTPDVLTDATADLTFALLLAAARQLPQSIESVKLGDWLTWEPGMYLGTSVHGATLGIIGLGRIGRAVARRAAGFKMTVLHTGSDGGIPLARLLADSDFVSIHCPLTPETRHLIDDGALAAMRSSAILINTARGPIVDPDALGRALHDGAIAGAALDVTEPEPLPAGHPLLQAPNLIVTPHVGSATREARERMADLAVENLIAALSGEPMPHGVN